VLFFVEHSLNIHLIVLSKKLEYKLKKKTPFMEVNLISTRKYNRTHIHKITHNDNYPLKTSNLNPNMQYTEKDLCSHMGTDLKDGVGAPAATNILFLTLKATILYSYAA
jgi:hypothetical protein